MGLIDFLSDQRIRNHRIAWLHFLGNVTILGLTLINLLVRSANNVPTIGLILSVIVGLLLLATGWFGGELSYKHRVGVLPLEEQHK
jgi:uncharacterized membrane protein